MARCFHHLKPLCIPRGDSFKKVYEEEWVQEVHASGYSEQESEYRWRDPSSWYWGTHVPTSKKTSIRLEHDSSDDGSKAFRPRLSICPPGTTAGAHLANYQPLQVIFPGRSHLGSHFLVRMRRGQSPQSRQWTHHWTLSHQTHQHHRRQDSPRPVWHHAQTTSFAAS